MIRKPVVVLIIMVCVLGMALASCAPGKDAKGRTFTDGAGNEVVLARKPQSIVSLALAADEMLIGLVEKDRIKALSYLSEDEGLSNISDMVDGIEKLGSNLEQVIAAQPDLVLVADWTDADFIRQLKEAGITVYVVASPNSMEDIKDNITALAALLWEEDRGKELTGWMEERLGDVEDRVSVLGEGQRARVLSIDAFYDTYGKGSTFDAIAAHAGVINLASEAGIEMWGQLSKEKVVEMNPDVIFLPSWSFEGFDAAEFAEQFRKDKALEDVKAVKEGRVYSLPEKHMTTYSQYIVLGVEDLAKAVYPRLFEEE